MTPEPKNPPPAGRVTPEQVIAAKVCRKCGKPFFGRTNSRYCKDPCQPARPPRFKEATVKELGRVRAAVVALGDGLFDEKPHAVVARVVAVLDARIAALTPKESA